MDREGGIGRGTGREVDREGGIGRGTGREGWGGGQGGRDGEGGIGRGD